MISREKELKRMRQLQILNYLYAITVVIMAVVVLVLVFSFSIEQREIINTISDSVIDRTIEAEELDRRSDARLNEALDRVDEIEKLILERLEPDRLHDLEERLLERLQDFIVEIHVDEDSL